MVKTLDYYIYLFDLIEQCENESFDSFLKRLKLYAIKCQFPNADEEVKRRIIAKCRSDALRHHFFDNQLTLDQVILTGRNFEKAECQRPVLKPPKPAKEKLQPVEDHCARCGSKDHRYLSDSCRAFNNRCSFCNNLGHLPDFCFLKRRIQKDGHQSESQSSTASEPTLYEWVSFRSDTKGDSHYISFQPSSNEKERRKI